MNSREAILNRIRQGKSLKPNEPRFEPPETYIKAYRTGPIALLKSDVITHFRTKAKLGESTLDEIRKLNEAPQAIARYLEANQLPYSGVCWPTLASLNWESANLRIEPRDAREGDKIGITGSFCAIAETGTLLLLSGEDTPATVSLLPETHIALLSIYRIVPTMEEAWKLLRTENHELPASVNFISGPSRTGDIEQTIVLGAHGPYRVHIILIQEP